MGKKKLKSWIVRMRITRIQDFIVEAIDENEAKRKARNFDSTEDNIIETPDWEVISVSANE